MDPRSHRAPRGSLVPNGLPGRSCSRGTPASSTRSRGKAKVWDALRFVFLMGAPEPEHRNQSIADVSRSPSASCPAVRATVPRLSVFGAPTMAWALGAMGRDSWTGRMWKCGVLVSGPGELAPECWFTLRSAGIQVPDDRLLRHRIHADAGSAGPAPGEVGVIPGRSQRPLSGLCLCLSALGVMTKGAAATFLAPPATTGNVGEWTPAARRRFRVVTAIWQE